MSISVACGDCHKQYNVKEEMAGKKFRCKECQTVIVVPEAEDDDPFSNLDLKSTGRALPREKEVEDYDDDDTPVRRSSNPGNSRSASRRRTRDDSMPIPAIVAIVCQCLLIGFGLLNAAAVAMQPVAQNDPSASARHTGAVIGSLFRIAISGAVLAGLLKRSNNARQWSRGLCVLAIVIVGIKVAVLFSKGGEDEVLEAAILMCLIATWTTIAICLSTDSADEWFSQ